MQDYHVEIETTGFVIVEASNLLEARKKVERERQHYASKVTVGSIEIIYVEEI